MTIIIGIDPGSRITGYGIVYLEKQPVYLTSGYVKATQVSIAERLETIFKELRNVIERYRPSEGAIEQVFFHRNACSALKLGQAQGVGILAASLSAIPLSEYSARQVKQSVTGYGAARKAQVQHMVQRLLNLVTPLPADAADALAVALCHAHMRSSLKQINQLSTSHFTWKKRFRRGRLR